MRCLRDELVKIFKCVQSGLIWSFCQKKKKLFFEVFEILEYEINVEVTKKFCKSSKNSESECKKFESIKNIILLVVESEKWKSSNFLISNVEIIFRSFFVFTKF